MNFKSWMHLGKRREKKTANTEGLAVWVVLKKKKVFRQSVVRIVV